MNESKFDETESVENNKTKRQIGPDEQYEVIYLSPDQISNGPIYLEPHLKEIPPIYPITPKFPPATTCAPPTTCAPRTTCAPIPCYTIRPVTLCPPRTPRPICSTAPTITTSSTGATAPSNSSTCPTCPSIENCCDCRSTITPTTASTPYTGTVPVTRGAINSVFATFPPKNTTTTKKPPTTTDPSKTTKKPKPTKRPTTKTTSHHTTQDPPTTPWNDSTENPDDDCDSSADCTCSNESGHNKNCKFYINKAVFNFCESSRNSNLLDLIEKLIQQMKNKNCQDSQDDDCDYSDDYCDSTENESDTSSCYTHQDLVESFKSLRTKLKSYEIPDESEADEDEDEDEYENDDDY